MDLQVPVPFQTASTPTRNAPRSDKTDSRSHSVGSPLDSHSVSFSCSRAVVPSRDAVSVPHAPPDTPTSGAVPRSRPALPPAQGSNASGFAVVPPSAALASSTPAVFLTRTGTAFVTTQASSRLLGSHGQVCLLALAMLPLFPPGLRQRWRVVREQCLRHAEWHVTPSSLPTDGKIMIMFALHRAILMSLCTRLPVALWWRIPD